MTYHLDQSSYEQYDQSHYIYFFILLLKEQRNKLQTIRQTQNKGTNEIKMLSISQVQRVYRVLQE